MRFTIKKDKLLKAVNLVSKPIPSKAIMPSLIFIKIKLTDEKLTLIGSNEVIAISSSIAIKDGENENIRNYKPGETLVQGKFFSEIIRKLNADEITIEILDNTILEITDYKSSFQLNTADVNEYPDYNFNEEGTEFDINPIDFSSLIEQTSFAAAIKENRLVLTGVNLEAKDNKLTAIGLDASRMSKKEIPLEINANFNVNIPAKTINEIIHMFEDAKNVHIVVNSKKIFFKFDNNVISSVLLNGEYPNASKFTPTNFNYNFEVNAQELLSALDRVTLLSDEKCTIKLTLSSDEVFIANAASEIGNAKEKINSFQYNNDKFEIYFNGNYVMDAIKALRSEDIVFEFISENKPFIIRKTDSKDIIELITPLRL